MNINSEKVVLIDDQYKNLINVLNDGLKEVQGYEISAIQFKEYYKVNTLDEYEESVRNFIKNISGTEKNDYCFLLDWQFVYNQNGVNKSEWYGVSLYNLLKKNGFNKILIFSNYTGESEFKQIMLEGGICFGKPTDDIIFIESNSRKQTEKRNKYFLHLKYLIHSLYSDKEIERYGMILGNNSVVNEIKELIEKSSKSDVSVLILGQTGTGKELTARAIHNLSERKNKKFLAINCGGIPSDLLETELFGYSPGTFTDQIKEGKQGLFREADGGTVLLDEIGDMPLLMQAKLLRFLQDHKVRPVGSSDEFPVDVRVICSTNKNLVKMMEEYEESLGSRGFRNDLYWRIKVFQIFLPSLKERIDYSDELIHILFFYFLRRAFRKNKIKRIADLYLSEESLELLKNYEWKGNFREFENVILSAATLLNDNENTIEAEEIRKFLTENYMEKSEIINYINILRNGGSLKDIPQKCHDVVILEYMCILKQSGRRAKTVDLIRVILNEIPSSDKLQLKKQSARVTQYLRRNNIKLI